MVKGCFAAAMANALLVSMAIGCRAAGKLAGQVIEVVVLSRGLSEYGGDAEGERVASDAGEMFAEQVSCSAGIAGGCGADHFDVVALPVHLPATGTSRRPVRASPA